MEIGEPTPIPLPDREGAADSRGAAPLFDSPTGSWLRRLFRREYFWLVLIVMATLAVHLVIITQPGEPLLDEQHYVPEAKSIIAGTGATQFVHPPLAKLIISGGILAFGDNPWGWRSGPILFGTAGIILFYLICRQLGLKRKETSLATFLLAFENLTFIQASVAMLDVYMLTFMLGGFLAYLKRNYPVASLLLVLCTLAKLTGALGFIAIGLHYLISRRDRPAYFWPSMAAAPFMFLALLSLGDFVANGQFMDPVSSVRRMMEQGATVTFKDYSHPSASRPWEWVIGISIMPYWYTPHYTGVISFTLWALIVPAAGYLVFLAVKERRSKLAPVDTSTGNPPSVIPAKAGIQEAGSSILLPGFPIGSGMTRSAFDAALFALCWFFALYLVWIPLDIVTDRLSFVYYFYPAVGAVCIGVAIGLSRLIDFWRARSTSPSVAETQAKTSGPLLSKRRTALRWLALILAALFLAAHLAVFFILSPLTGSYYFT